MGCGESSDHTGLTATYYYDWYEYTPPLSAVLNKPEAMGKIICYPNPCTNSLSIDLTRKSKKYFYTIQNICGVTIINGTLPTNNIINTSSLSNGTYILTINSEEGKSNSVITKGK